MKSQPLPGGSTRNRRRRGSALVASLALAVTMAACGTGTDRRAIAAATVGGDPGFSPRTLTVDKEDAIRLKVGNGTARQHGFAIEGYKVRRTVDPNQTLDVRFKASRAGTFKIFCQLHPTHQTGTLVVR
ncbi:MAG: cupredoxin domain-containing protein [Acidimicrobiales bacterium]|nr:cupredoxin domain-containing protein [Actinomycetota bacterium]